MIAILKYYIEIGGYWLFFVFFVMLLVVYFIIKVYVLLARYLIRREKTTKKEAKHFFVSFGYVLVSIQLGALALGALTLAVTSHPSHSAIMASGDLFMALDKKLFGVYPPFWLHSTLNPYKYFFDALSPLVVSIYGNLVLVLGLIFTLTLVANSRRFYAMLLAFFLCAMIALPFWYLVPALTPVERYVDNILAMPVQEDIQDTLRSYEPNENVSSYLDGLRSRRNQNTDGFLEITTMPSMHVAWGTVIAYFGIRLWAPLAIVLVPYFLVNAFSTVYVLQHHAVDVLVGFLVAVMAIMLAELIIKKIPPTKKPALSTIIQQDLIHLTGLIHRLFKRVAKIVKDIRSVISG